MSHLPATLSPFHPLIHQVFGNIDLNPKTDITRHNNFRTFIQGLMLLFRWNIRDRKYFDHLKLDANNQLYHSQFSI